jgi:hypothetical protein
MRWQQLSAKSLIARVTAHIQHKTRATMEKIGISSGKQKAYASTSLHKCTCNLHSRFPWFSSISFFYSILYSDSVSTSFFRAGEFVQGEICANMYTARVGASSRRWVHQVGTLHASASKCTSSYTWLIRKADRIRKKKTTTSISETGNITHDLISAPAFLRVKAQQGRREKNVYNIFCFPHVSTQGKTWHSERKWSNPSWRIVLTQTQIFLKKKNTYV